MTSDKLTICPKCGSDACYVQEVNNEITNLRIGAGYNESSAALFLSDGSLIDDFRFYN